MHTQAPHEDGPTPSNPHTQLISTKPILPLQEMDMNMDVIPTQELVNTNCVALQQFENSCYFHKGQPKGPIIKQTPNFLKASVVGQSKNKGKCTQTKPNALNQPLQVSRMEVKRSWMSSWFPKSNKFPNDHYILEYMGSS